MASDEPEWWIWEPELMAYALQYRNFAMMQWLYEN